MKYDYQVSQHKKKKFVKRLYIPALIILIILAIFASIIKIDTYLQNQKNTPAQTTSQQTTAFYDTKDKIYRAKYFQFQTRNTWVEIPSETTENKYVYRNMRGSLIEEELVVYVNSIPSDVHATRSLPITIKNDGQFEVGIVTDHCSKALKNQTSSRDQEVAFGGTTILCDSDSTQYEVLIGLKGGGTKLSLKRPDGTSADYTIFYRNVKATPDATQLYGLVTSFQAR